MAGTRAALRDGVVRQVRSPGFIGLGGGRDASEPLAGLWCPALSTIRTRSTEDAAIPGMRISMVAACGGVRVLSRRRFSKRGGATCHCLRGITPDITLA